MTELKGEYVRANLKLASAVLGMLILSTEGPAEAYATLICTLKLLTDEHHPAATDDDIIAEFAQSWRSIREVNSAQAN